MNCPDCGCGLTEDTTMGYYKSVSNPDPHQEASRMTRTKQEAVEQLREIFPRDTEVHTILRSVSRSGMERAISVVAIVDGQPRDVSYLVAPVTDSKLHPKHAGIKRNGTGMDMGYDLVDSLSWALYGEGYALRHRWL